MKSIVSFKRDVYILLACGALAFVPFINRAVFVDDHAHFGQAVRWGSGHEPLYTMASGLGWKAGGAPGEANPVLYFLYYGTFTRIFGAQEWKAHVAMWPWNFLALFAFYALARRFTRHALWAALLWLLTPYFWLTANSLLIDALVAPLFLASLAIWMKGWEKGSRVWLLLGGLLLGAAPLVKYTGLAVWAVAALWSWRQTKTIKDWRWCYGVVPLALFGLWLVFTKIVYGQTHFLSVAGDRMARPSAAHLLLIFMFLFGTTPAIAAALLARCSGRVHADQSADRLFLWGWIGLGVLALWVAIPWICARYLVIFGPAAILLSVREMENTRWGGKAIFRGGVLLFSALFGFLLAHADYVQAEIDREISKQVAGETGRYPAAALGGLSFYLDASRWRGASPGEVVSGDILVPSRTLTPMFWPRIEEKVVVKKRWTYDTWNPVRVLDYRTGAGFYGSIWGPFPFTLSREPIETYLLVSQ